MVIAANKAQVSMEYLSVMGISLLLIMPMIIIFYQQSASLQDDITAAQIERIGQELMNAAENVYYLGPPSQQELTIYLPTHYQSGSVGGQEMNFTYTLSELTLTYPVATSLPLNLSGTLPAHPGKYYLLVKATENGVSISEQS